MRKKTYLTTRAALYMCMLILTILFVPVCGGDKIMQVALIAASVVIWSITFRFIERPSLLPLNLFFNTLLAAAPSLVLFFGLGTENFAAMLPLSVGLTALTAMPGDGKKTYERPDTMSELITPSVIAFGVGVASCSIYIIVGHKVISASIMMASALLMLISVLIRKFTGKEVMFSSRYINDIGNIPADDRENLRSFAVHRGIAFGSAVIIETALFFSLKIPDIHPLDLFDIKPVICALIACILSLVFHKKINDKSFGGGFFPYEILLSFGILVIPYIISDPILRTISIPLAPVMFSLTDMLVTGFLCTYKRRRLSSVRHYFSEGMPMLLMTLGFLVMGVEVFAHLIL